MQLNAQLPVVTGGNPDLEPETSESWVFGAVWRPSFLPRLSLEANYFDIQVDGAIQAIDAGTLLGRCATTPDALSCDSITRSASGQVAQISGFLQNIASIETDGIDVTLNYRSPPNRGGDVRHFLGQHLPVQLHGHRSRDRGRDGDRARRHRAGQPRPGLPEVQVDRDPRLDRRTISALR